MIFLARDNDNTRRRGAQRTFRTITSCGLNSGGPVRAAVNRKIAELGGVVQGGRAPGPPQHDDLF
jgi:hypothetical protein